MSFLCVTISPAHRDPGIAIAAMRAGGIGVLDTEFCAHAADVSRVPGAGLRLSCARIDEFAACLDAMAHQPHSIILFDWTVEELGAQLTNVQHPHREIWIEVRSARECRNIPSDLPFHGWLARGSETGGRSGCESSFVLCQHLANQHKPFLVQGGIGPRSAAACRVAGAAGVVLDDSLLLLRESFLSPRERMYLDNFSVEDTISIGPASSPYRIAARASFTRLGELKLAAEKCGDDHTTWSHCVRERIGWGSPEEQVWPLGQTAGLAAEIEARYRTTGRYLQAIRLASEPQAGTPALSPGSPLALSHGTTYPIVQGPMTRVSDNVPFALSVAQSGGLPLLALALMRGPQVQSLLEEAKQTLGDRPWGVGILGFVPADLRAEQLAVVEKIRPPFALIAGGRPDQAKNLEALGITTYIHAPTPQLLRLFLEQGSRRFVFEGGECGGHVGPLNSFPLWMSAIDVLISAIPPEQAGDVHVLFAGGIHDARSAAMVAALARPLADRGMKIGVLMGTAYLFTEEIVASGAVVPGFQDEALACDSTSILDTRPGHRIRVAPTPFVSFFESQRAALHHDADQLENLIVGRARIASKGLTRIAGDVRSVSQDEQRENGMFMMGELAALRSRRISCAQLHEDVSAGSTALLLAASPLTKSRRSAQQRPAAVAIVGIGCLTPGAHDAETLWRNLLDQREFIREIPAERWDWRLYYDADPSARDRIYAKWGGFLDPLPFDPIRFGIPPNSLPSISLPQLIALEVTRLALIDAGYGQSIADAALREKTAVFIGAANTADVEQMYKARTALPLCVGAVNEEALRRLPEWTEESYPGILVNIIAGRIANRFDLSGPNFTVDAACASALAALDLAVRELESHRSDLVLAGGVELEQSPQAYMAFSKTRALSPHGQSRVFDEEADGIVLSEGAVILVLKRLQDAERDGDRIYAVLRGVAGASDGKGMGLTAPQTRGQLLAIERANSMAGSNVAQMGMYEAHATGTAVGDRTELETICQALQRAGAPPAVCAIGSAKSLLGHTRAAAGMVGLVKAALALAHRTLPPHAGVKKPMRPIEDASAPVYLLDAPRPWLSSETRFAGVSAFGFGGAGFHAVLEEYRSDPAGIAAPGASVWPYELFLLSASSKEDLRRQLQHLREALDDHSIPLRDIAFACALGMQQGPFRFAAVATSREELNQAIRNHHTEPAEPGELAFLFPGQGGQYSGMGVELGVYFEPVRQAFADSLASLPSDKPWHTILFPSAEFSSQAGAERRKTLANTRIAQPTIATISCGMLDLATKLELKPTRAAGHSFGEFVALHSAGVINRADLLRLADVRGQLLASACGDTGAMASVPLPPELLQRFLESISEVWISNRNAPNQTVLSGRATELDRVAERLRMAGHSCTRLNVSTAFHCPLMGSARDQFSHLTASLAIAAPQFPVHGNLDGAPYPSSADLIRERWVEHLEKPVDFVSQIQRMHESGVRTFVEMGPGQVATNLVKHILGNQPHLAVPADGGLRGWLEMLAAVFRAGHSFQYTALFDGRPVRARRLDSIAGPVSKPSAWLIDGGRVWSVDGNTTTTRERYLDSTTNLPALTSSGILNTHVSEIYREYQQTMRQFLEQQERTLMHLASGAITPVEPPAALPAPREPVARETPGTAPVHMDRAQLTQHLITIVSERTGYPREMLQLDQDLEAELGVDSIKRIEILTKLQKSLPAEFASTVRLSLDRLTTAKSIHHIVDLLMKQTPAQPIRTARDADSHVPRYRMRSSESPLLPVTDSLGDGLFLVTEDNLGIADAVVEKLRERGVRACLMHRPDLRSAERASERVAVLEQVHGPVKGIVHLAALGLPAVPGSLQIWRESTALAVKSLFSILRQCAPSLQDAEPPVRIVAVSQLGGEWGRNSRMLGSPAAAGSHGMLRSLDREYPLVVSKMVDFDDTLAPTVVAARIVDEVVNAGGGHEVGYVGERRLVFSCEPATFSAEPKTDWHPQEGWVILATGGARGITAAICRHLVRPGVRLVLVGRSPEFGDDNDERRNNIEAFRDAGAIVEYRSVDVRSEREFGVLIDDVYASYGRIDAVLHGAGIIEDRRLEDKDAHSFNRVFDTKADSTFMLTRKLRPDTLKWVALFSSVSGRFGNHGQSDYAAANETMNRLAWQMASRWPATRVVSINWGPWKGTGMAGETVQALLEAEGILAIDAIEGWRFFENELSRGDAADVEIIAGKGPWSDALDQSIVSALQASLLVFEDADLLRMMAHSG